MAIFEASAEGFRQQQMGRPPEHLVRELIQNVLDESATQLHVTVRYSPAKGAVIVVEDNVAGGFRDEKLVFTIWQSDKQDVPTKRGRMGRGLKEMVSVADRTVVETQGRGAITFTRDRAEPHEWARSQKQKPCDRVQGSRVECWVSAWKQRDVSRIIKFLHNIRPPADLEFTVNGERIVRIEPTERYGMRLLAPVFEINEGERKELTRTFDTFVELFPEADGDTFIYEMGIPVEAWDYPLSVDVGQRIPLREKRDAILDWWRRDLLAALLNKRLDKYTDEQLRDDHVLIAAGNVYDLSKESQERLLKVWTEGKPYAATAEAFRHATGQHIEVVSLRKLPEAIRELVKVKGTKVEEVLEQRRGELCPPVLRDEQTPEQRRFIDIWEWIARGVNRPSTVTLNGGHPTALASYDRAARHLSVYVEQVSVNIVRKPLSAEALSILIHELSHWEQKEDAHGMDFHSDAEHIGAEVAVFLLKNAEEAQAKARQ